MLVVSDTSPISSLLQIGRIELLRDLFQIIYIPQAVSDELKQFHQQVPDFFELRDITDRTQVEDLSSELDLGEAEAITLASELNADYLLIDERRGRAIAARSGVTVIGLLGVLLLARRRDLIESLKECIDELRTKAGFYVSDEIVEKVLRAAGE